MVIDSATMQIIRWTKGGFGMAAHNYDVCNLCVFLFEKAFYRLYVITIKILIISIQRK